MQATIQEPQYTQTHIHTLDEGGYSEDVFFRTNLEAAPSLDFACLLLLHCISLYYPGLPRLLTVLLG